MYKFGQIEIESKKFNSIYEVQKDIDLEKIRVSEGVVANKHDTRYIVGYEVESGERRIGGQQKYTFLFDGQNPR